MGAAARRLAASTYSLTRQVDALLALWRSILHASQPPHLREAAR